MKKLFFGAVIAGCIFLETAMGIAEEAWPHLAKLDAPVPVKEETVSNIVEYIEARVEVGEAAGKDELVKMIADSVNTNAEITFKSYLLDPIPEGVEILEGTSSHWNGFSAYLLLQVSPEGMQSLTKGYSKLPLGVVQAQAKTWFKEDVTAIPDVVCYFRADTITKYYLFLDQTTGRVFFKGIEG